MKTIDPELLTLLVCPLSKAELVEYQNKIVSTDRATRRVYQIVEGIPDLLIEHSSVLELSEWERIMKASGR